VSILNFCDFNVEIIELFSFWPIDRARFVKRTNSHRFLLRDDIWNAPGVRDVTPELRAVDF
jgi:hypothetical protein